MPEGSSWPWVALVGMEGLGGLGRPNAADRPDQRGATGRSKVKLLEFAELWRRKRATVYWSRLEQPEAGAERARSVSEASVERKRNVSGTRAEAEASFRPRSGRSNTRCRAVEGTAGFGRPWTGKGCRHWSSPAEGRRMPPTNNEPDSRILRRLRRGLSEGPGSREGPGAKAPCARQPTHPATESR